MAIRLTVKEREADENTLLAELQLRIAVEDIIQLMINDGFEDSLYYRMLSEAIRQYDDVKDMINISRGLE